MRPEIVCGVDASEGARAAARVAGGLAEALHADLVLVHVASMGGSSVRPLSWARTPELHDAWRRRVTRAAAELLDEIVDDVGAPPSTARICLFGDPAFRLATVAERRAALALVVGCRRRGPMRAAVLGSVSAELATGASCPVLVVPEGAGDGVARLRRDLHDDPLVPGPC